MTVTISDDKPTTLIILGGGQRGVIYANYALLHPDKARVVAVADPREVRRKIFARSHRLTPDQLFSDWTQVAARPKFADAVIVAVLDQMHSPVVAAFAQLGYHILCEKPMATSVADCVRMVRQVSAAGVIFTVGHVLRYSNYSRLVKQVIDSGALGDIINIQHMNPVGNEHFAHSYVRGNWGREATSSFSLLTKCCHDLDVLSFYLSGLPVRRVSSFGSLAHFNQKNKPAAAGAATRCLQCPAQDECVWSARKIYLDAFDPATASGRRLNWSKKVMRDADVTYPNVRARLESGPYGRCVYEADNDVVDHQVVLLEYAGGVTATMTMSAFSEAKCDRRTVIQGTKGELDGDALTFTVFDFATRNKRTYYPPKPEEGHCRRDQGLASTFCRAITQLDQTCLGVTPEDILDSHLLVFAAEQARLEGRIVDFDQFKAGVVANEKAGAGAGADQPLSLSW